MLIIVLECLKAKYADPQLSLVLSLAKSKDCAADYLDVDMESADKEWQGADRNRK